MPKKIRISEEQYNTLIDEGIDLKADVAATNGDIKAAVTNAKTEAQKNGIDPKKTNITISGSDLTENRVITMKTLKENRLKALKENSKVMSFRDFVKQNKH